MKHCITVAGFKVPRKDAIWPAGQVPPIESFQGSYVCDDEPLDISVAKILAYRMRKDGRFVYKIMQAQVNAEMTEVDGDSGSGSELSGTEGGSDLSQ